MLQRVLSEAGWATRLTVEDLRALTPLIYAHVSPYGHFLLDMLTRLNLELPLGRRIRSAAAPIDPERRPPAHARRRSPNESSAARLVLAVRLIGQTSWRLVTRVLGLGHLRSTRSITSGCTCRRPSCSFSISPHRPKQWPIEILTVSRHCQVVFDALGCLWN